MLFERAPTGRPRGTSPFLELPAAQNEQVVLFAKPPIASQNLAVGADQHEIEIRMPLRRGHDYIDIEQVIEGAEAFGISSETFSAGLNRIGRRRDRRPLPCTSVLSAKLFPSDERRRKRWAARLLHKLEQGKIKALVKVLRRFSTPNQESAHLLANEADYFERNAERMRYPSFAARDAVRKGAHRKRPRWDGRFEDYWEARARAA